MKQRRKTLSPKYQSNGYRFSLSTNFDGFLAFKTLRLISFLRESQSLSSQG
jgi:hypothetical protein